MTDLQTLLLTLTTIFGFINVLIVLQHETLGRAKKGKRVVLDTCALIDGRIVEIAQAGFVPTLLLIPRPVVRELQFLADQADPTKRERARFGLDVINQLQQLKGVEVKIVAHKSRELVDEQLIAVAKQYGAQLYTTDYNLNKVALVEGVNVLNVNELAQALRTQYLPGEKTTIKLVQKGQNAQQAVGYLDDGTMVVVEHAKQYVGKQVTVEFSRVLQTQAGKMMFASIQKNNLSTGSSRTVQKHETQQRSRNPRRSTVPTKTQ